MTVVSEPIVTDEGPVPPSPKFFTAAFLRRPALAPVASAATSSALAPGVAAIPSNEIATEQPLPVPEIDAPDASAVIMNAASLLVQTTFPARLTSKLP